MNVKATPQKIETMRQHLGQIRKASLTASRNGDFLQVARLTAQAARVNKAILDAECQLVAGY